MGEEGEPKKKRSLIAIAIAGRTPSRRRPRARTTRAGAREEEEGVVEPPVLLAAKRRHARARAATLSPEAGTFVIGGGRRLRARGRCRAARWDPRAGS